MLGPTHCRKAPTRISASIIALPVVTNCGLQFGVPSKQFRRARKLRLSSFCEAGKGLPAALAPTCYNGGRSAYLLATGSGYPHFRGKTWTNTRSQHFQHLGSDPLTSALCRETLVKTAACMMAANNATVSSQVKMCDWSLGSYVAMRRTRANQLFILRGRISDRSTLSTVAAFSSVTTICHIDPWSLWPTMSRARSMASFLASAALDNKIPSESFTRILRALLKQVKIIALHRWLAFVALRPHAPSPGRSKRLTISSARVI